MVKGREITNKDKELNETEFYALEHSSILVSLYILIMNHKIINNFSIFIYKGTAVHLVYLSSILQNIGWIFGLRIENVVHAKF